MKKCLVILVIIFFICALVIGQRGRYDYDGDRNVTGTLDVTGVTTITGIADGGRTNYDLKVGDTTTPDYGMIQFGNAVIGRTSYKAGNIDLNGAILLQNIGGPVTGQIEFVFAESAGGTCRFALPKSGVGNATYNPRSMLIAGPAPADTNFVTVGYWQGQGIFHNLVCDTAGSGAEFGVQGKAEFEDILYVDDINESTPGAGITLGNNVDIDGALGLAIVTVTGNTTLDDTHSTVLVNANGNVTIALPTAASAYNNADDIGRKYEVKKIDADADTVTVDPNSSEEIEFSPTAILTVQGEGITFQSNGTAWYIL